MSGGGGGGGPKIRYKQVHSRSSFYSERFGSNASAETQTIPKFI